LSGADAVRITTLNSARSLGVERQFGSVECGKTADLAILDGDPLADVRVIGSRVAALFVAGRLTINDCGLRVVPAG
jgi:imidazolonepropionase-like amidohydrolase